MARYREKHSHEEAREFVDSIAGTFAVVLFVITLIGVVAAPVLVAIVAPGFIGDGGDFELASMMLRFTFPYLFFVSMTAFAGGILNTLWSLRRAGIHASDPQYRSDRCGLFLGATAAGAGDGAGLCGTGRRYSPAAVSDSVPAQDTRAAATQMEPGTRWCAAIDAPDAAGDIRLLCCTDQRVGRRNNRLITWCGGKSACCTTRTASWSSHWDYSE